jgi:hypothetical protein
MQLPPYRQLLLIDIETVSRTSSYAELSEDWKGLWEAKIAWQLPEDGDPAQFYLDRAAIMAEFGKIICISAGYFREEADGWQLRVRSFYGDDEPAIIQGFSQAVGQFSNLSKQKVWFAGHNIREFDLPYLCRRMLINDIPLPTWLDFQAMKPWDVPVVDTLQLWKFGDYKHYTSLALLAACLGIDSPKNDMDGSMVGDVYWKTHDLERIADYCQQDVITVAQLLLRLQGKPLLQKAQIIVAGRNGEP